jgi:SAM-dependent methyltransferase
VELREAAPGLTNPYDAVPYEGHAYAQTHPDRLATQAVLFGLRPTPPSRCRVLELGCGDGGNLLPMALELPRSEFVGIDLATEPVMRGTALARELGAGNLQLVQADLQELPDDLGSFDYLIAHGVYSWVPPGPRDALLAAAGRLLTPHGVAYVSYNAYPGSYLRDAARDVLRFHVEHEPDPERRMEQADALMRLIVRAGRASPHARALAEHLEAMLARPHWVVFHDELAEVNTPVYFHEFVAHARRHGLEFLAESHLADSQLLDLPPDVAAELERLPDDVVLREQYIDFVANRLFRQTLLCRADAPLRRELRATDLQSMWVAAPARTEATGAALDGSERVRFELAHGQVIETDDAQLKHALVRLGRAWPRCIRFADLAGAAPQRLGEALLGAHAERLVDLHVQPPAAAPAGDRPVAAPLVRRQAAKGSVSVTSLRHATIRVEDELGRLLLTRLDGSRDRAALAAELHSAEPAVPDARAALDAALDRLARLSLLAG